MHMGCQGIVVSNHGGRALDGAPASIIVLLELHRECAEVFDHMDIFIDGGFRRGSDVLKALCLGASGVGLGRPFQYAINYGTEGVERVVNSTLPPFATFFLQCHANLARFVSTQRRSRNSHASGRAQDAGRSRSFVGQHRRAGCPCPSWFPSSIRSQTCWASKTIPSMNNPRLDRLASKACPHTRVCLAVRR